MLPNPNPYLLIQINFTTKLLHIVSIFSKPKTHHSLCQLCYHSVNMFCGHQTPENPLTGTQFTHPERMTRKLLEAKQKLREEGEWTFFFNTLRLNDDVLLPCPAVVSLCHLFHSNSIFTIETKAPKIEPHGFEKPTKSSIVVCGKLGSVNALSEGGAKNRKGDKIEEKAKAANVKKADGAAFVKVEDKGIRKRRTQERGGRRGTSTRGRNAAKPTKPHEYGVNELSSHDGLDALKVGKEKKENVRKKKGAARFLKRMKQTSK
ncbi:hypothetical protein ACFX15_028291 [Malus domestica]